MNERQKWRVVNEALREVEVSNKSGSHRGCVRFNAASTKEHEMKKAELAWNLLQAGREFLTEAKFTNNRGRADVLDLSTHTVTEVVNSESEESIVLKRKKYPFPVFVVRVV